MTEVARTHAEALTRGSPAGANPRRGKPDPEADVRPAVRPHRNSLAQGADSFGVAAAYAFFEERITGRLLGGEPRATLDQVRMGRKKMFATSARAEPNWGFRGRCPSTPALRRAIAWSRAQGYAPPA